MDEARRALLLALLLAFPATYALRPVDDNDIFFHVRTGSWILENGFPRTDPFTVFGQGKPYVAYSWLFQLLVHAAHARAGFLGIAVLEAGLAVLVALVTWRLVARRGAGFTASAGVTALALTALLRTIGPRSWLFTIFFFAIELDLVLDARERKDDKKLFWLVPTFAVWANVHIQFVYGLAVLGVLALERLVETRRFPRTLSGVLAACTAATLANPYGIGLHRTILEYASASTAYTLVGEHAAPTFRSLPDWCVLATALAGAGALGWRRERRVFPHALLALGVLLGFRSGRDGFAVVLIGASLLAGALPKEEDEKLSASHARWIAVLAGSALFLVATAFARGLNEEKMQREIARVFPAAAAGEVEKHDLGGPVFCDYDWGSYLIYRLPGRLVSIDGRTNLHGDERIARSRALWSGAPGWEKDEELAAAGCVVANADKPLAALLANDRRFALVHRDEVACVFSRCR